MSAVPLSSDKAGDEARPARASKNDRRAIIPIPDHLKQTTSPSSRKIIMPGEKITIEIAQM
jgi:hypothetical protein